MPLKKCSQGRLINIGNKEANLTNRHANATIRTVRRWDRTQVLYDGLVFFVRQCNSLNPSKFGLRHRGISQFSSFHDNHLN